MCEAAWRGVCVCVCVCGWVWVCACACACACAWVRVYGCASVVGHRLADEATGPSPEVDPAPNVTPLGGSGRFGGPDDDDGGGGA
jgi:hypothetical protein